MTTVRHYPLIITRDEEQDCYLAICPDLELATAIHGITDLQEVCGCAISTIHMLTSTMRDDGIPLPPATPMDEARKCLPANTVLFSRVIVCQGKGVEMSDDYPEPKNST